MDIIPPFRKFGIVVEGGHFFTFDGKSFSMPGDCSYILAQDILDGNFSVVANFNKGSLISVTVTEPKESITLKHNGEVSLFLLSLNQFPVARRQVTSLNVCDVNRDWSKRGAKKERERERGGRERNHR